MQNTVEWVKEELTKILQEIRDIEALCDRYERASSPESRELQQELKARYGSFKRHLENEYRRTSNLICSGPLSAYYAPAIHEAYVAMSGFGTNLVSKNNLSTLRQILYDAEMTIRFYLPQ
ncbi:MAG: hypothetical protein HPY55_16015 [Firmicutes bacterium]|nr:hypothetical protein [Bacillota bacterium]